LLWKEKQGFAIREGGRTVGAGVVTKIINKMPATKKPTTTTRKTSVKSASAVKPVTRQIKGELARLRIKLRAYDHKIIDNSAHQIIDIANRYGAEIIGPIPLPTEILKYTVNPLHLCTKTPESSLK
jgi:hypothetical protein